MAADRWQRAKDVFQAALTRAPDARAAFLDEACGGDHSLRGEVESLLTSHDEAGGFLSRAAVLDTGPSGGPNESVTESRRIGPYLVLDTIGRGGMGTVYRAVRDDDAFHKTVALKLVRGGYGSEFIEHRFRQERQILARLQHPNIAAVFDGGTTDDGQPYLVMEYVDGLPITEFCAARSLATRERLALFQTVCDAVQYAHQNLVIHRDLKPDNILVTSEGAPKLLDFGIAKLLAAGVDPEEAPTATLLPMMTPEYASPEQVKGEAVTTASDVYSLGVLFYELLTGQRPYAVRTDSLPEIVRMVCETEPPLPSTALAQKASVPGSASSRRGPASELRGDLDTIVMKALRKEPSRRYVSVQALSGDIRRYLEGLPVLARPDTLRYRASKFVARHKAGVAATSLVFVSLVGAVVITARQARIAEKRLQETRRLANALVFDVFDAVKLGTTSTRYVIAKTGLEYLDRLAAEPHQDPRQRLELSTAYVKLGDAQGLPEFTNLGDTRGALESFRKALAIREQLAAEAPSDPKAAQQVATVHNRMGRVLRATGDANGALEHHRAALRIALDAARALGDVASRRRIVMGRWELCNTFVLMGQAPDALREAREGLTVAAQLLEESPSPDTRNVYAAPLECEGDALALQGDTKGAVAQLLESLTISQNLASGDPPEGQAPLDAVVVETKVAEHLASLGKFAEARRRLDDAKRAAEGLVATDSPDIEGRLVLAEARLGSANLTARTDPKRALGEYEKALAGFREVARADSANLHVRLRLGTLLLHKGQAELAAGLLGEARKSLGEAGSLAQALKDKSPAIREHHVLFARVRSQQGRLDRSSPDPGRCAMLRDAAEAWTSLAGHVGLTPSEASEQGEAAAAAEACEAGQKAVGG